MGDTAGTVSDKQLTIRHRGRITQIRIFFKKLIRMFIYQSDWKVLPMAALIAGLVGIVMSGDFMVTMEGTLMCAFAMACVCIWNGSFNSIQVICRERDVIKREHRSGMHVSSYIAAHMMYQLLLCLLQTIVTLLVCYLVGMKYTGKGLFTPWLILDIGITMLLITYAADMLSLWISTLCHSTTTAMTIMPFVLIFQLIFSGSMIAIPPFAKPITMLTISNPGIKAMCAQTQVNDLPYETITDMVNMVKNLEVGGTVTVGQVLDALQVTDNDTVSQIRAVEIGNLMTVGEIGEDLIHSENYADLRSETILGNVTVGQVLEAIFEADFMDEYKDISVGYETTLGGVVDYLASAEGMESLREAGLTIETSVGDILDLMGEEEMRERISEYATKANYNPEYEYSRRNVAMNWVHILIFIVVFSLLSVITLEFIDKDKR